MPATADPDLAAYRTAVRACTAELAEQFPAPDASARADRAIVESAISAGLNAAPIRAVLDLVPGGAESVASQAADELHLFRGGPASNAADPAGLVRILLLQQIDLMWWAAQSDFGTADDINAAQELGDLRAAGDRLRFRFKTAPRSFLGRARNSVVRRIAAGHEPATTGLSCLRARPEMVALLDDLAARFATAAPAGTPPLWLNSLTRSVAHQRKLRSLGYSALLPSAHCRGWAADLTMTWYERFSAAGALRDVLLRAQQDGIINVIDEGSAWHVCLAPPARAAYAGAAVALGFIGQPAEGS